MTSYAQLGCYMKLSGSSDWSGESRDEHVSSCVLMFSIIVMKYGCGQYPLSWHLLVHG